MIPKDQTITSSIDGSVHGNCMAACLASMLEIEIEQVPALQNMGDEWAGTMIEFLDGLGYEFDGTIHEHRLSDVLSYPGIDGYVMAFGESHRLHVTRGHAVLYKDGVLVHDPHPAKDGLKKLNGYYMIRRKTEEEIKRDNK